MFDNKAIGQLIVFYILIIFIFGVLIGKCAFAASYCPCDYTNQNESSICLPKKACEKRFPDDQCLKAPKLSDGIYLLKCEEVEYDGAPIYSEECPEGNIVGVEQVCEPPEECRDVEQYCEPIGHEKFTRLEIVPDEPRREQFRQARAAKEELQRRESAAMAELRDALVKDDQGDPLDDESRGKRIAALRKILKESESEE